jgi:phage terminase large subunit
MRAVDLGYRPRPQFIPYHMRKERWAVIVAHRRAGKTVACVMDQIDAALRCPLPNPRTAYIAPLYKQAKDVAWTYAKEFTNAIPGVAVNESELRIDFPNGGRFRLYGADNPDALRGIYLDDCVLDEFADMRPRFLPTVIRPALSDRKGRLTVIGTPKGHNEFFDTYESAKVDPEWFYLMLRASETGLVDADELVSAAKLMSEAQYAQEYECSFEAAIEGS